MTNYDSTEILVIGRQQKSSQVIKRGIWRESWDQEHTIIVKYNTWLSPKSLGYTDFITFQ